MILSGLSMPGRMARPSAPARCMPNISRAQTMVPMRDAPVQRLAVPVAKAAQRRVGQAHHPDADQHPEAQHEGLGQHVAGPWGLTSFWDLSP